MPYFRVLIFAVVSFVIAGCSTWGKEDADWYLGVAAPEHYDNWVINFHAEKPGERSWRIPIGYVGCCWKGEFGPVGGGGRLDPFPSLMAFHWFSFAEQKFYSTFIRVPEDLQERMREPVEHSYMDGTTGLRPRSTLVLGLAPGGEVVVWMMSQRTNAVEVMRVPAVEVEGDPDDFKARTQAYRQEHGDYLKQHGLQLGRW